MLVFSLGFRYTRKEEMSISLSSFPVNVVMFSIIFMFLDIFVFFVLGRHVWMSR